MSNRGIGTLLRLFVIIAVTLAVVWGVGVLFDAKPAIFAQSPPLVRIASVDDAGTPGDDNSGAADLSGDGRYVVFRSDAANLVVSDTNSVRDVFLHDIQTAQTQQVSVASDGTQGNFDSGDLTSYGGPVVSGDGRYVAFTSDASNLIAGDTNNQGDIFVHDVQTGETVLASKAADGTQGALWSQTPAISGDGRYVAFSSRSTGLVPGDTNGQYQIFVHDRDTDDDGTFDETGAISTTVVSIAGDGTLGNSGSGSAGNVDISPDGRFVTFDSYATNLVMSDTNGVRDVFVHDRDTDEDGVYDEAGAVSTVRVSVASDGTQANAVSSDPAISADGRFVTFWTQATNLFPNDTVMCSTINCYDVVVHDRDVDGDGVFDEAGAISTTLAARASDGTPSNSYSYYPDISNDGTYITFYSDASNLVASDTAWVDVFVHNRQTGETRQVSLTEFGQQPNNSSLLPAMSGNGRFVTFQSQANNIVAADFGFQQDVFVFDRQGDLPTPTPTNTPIVTNTPTPTPTATPPAPTPAGAEGWQRDIAASAGSAGFSPDVALDSNDRPHFTHIESDAQTIEYAHWDGVRWYREAVTDTTFSQAETFIAVDGQDQPHLLYQTRFTEWEYSRRSGGQWQPIATLTAQTTADVIMDGNDRLAVAYENDSSKLTVSRWMGNTWQSTQIDNRLLDEVAAALVAGSGDELHLAYLVPSPDREVIYSHFDGSSWSTETVGTLDIFAEPEEVDLTLNGLNQPVILYTFDDTGPDRLMRVTKSGATWNEEEVFASGSDITAPSLAYDSQGQAHVLFRLNGRPYYDSDDAGWQFTALPGDENLQELSGLVLDSGGAPHFAFRDATYANLNYQFFGPAWEIHTLEASDSARLPAVSHVQHEVGVSFYSLDNQQLRFFERQPDAWQEKPVAGMSLPVVDSSLRMDLRGQHAVSYRDSVNDRLMFARFDGIAWQTEIVDDFADVGYDNTLFILPDGQLIVYWDADNHRVKIARNNGSGWALFADDVAPPQNSSSGRPRAVLQGNNVYVSYYDGVNEAVRLATFDLASQVWSDTLLAGGDGTVIGPHHDITQVNGMQLLVTYHDEAAEQIMLGTRQAGAGTWSFDTVAVGITSIGGLELEAKSYDTSGSLRLVYLDGSANSVVLASRIDGTWSFETVRDGDNFLAEPSLALGERPYLAYSAIGSDALEFAVRVPHELQRGVLYNPYNPGDNGDNDNFLVDVCAALLDDDDDSLVLSSVQTRLQPASVAAIGDDYDVYAAMTELFLATPEGRHYTDLYVQHLKEVVAIGADDPRLLWDSYQTLQDFMPGLEALVTGEGDSVVVTQRMANNALDIWQRLAAAGSPALAQDINDELAASNNLQDFVGMTFDEWALAIGVQPHGETSVFLPMVAR